MQEDIQSKILSLVDAGLINRMTYGEIASKLGLKYRSQPKHYIEKMLNDGLLLRDKAGGLMRTPSSDARSLISLPVMGEANCGIATIYADNEVCGVIHVSPASLSNQSLKKGSFAVKASGDSMNNSNINGKSINDGDFAIIAPTEWSYAADGDYILSVIDGMGNIKRLRLDPENSRIILKSESRDYFDDIIIHIEDLYMYQIAGRVVDVIKAANV
jgi:SOS-response transcriptional repressor LexA